MYCSNCGKKNKNKNLFCSVCGNSLSNSYAKQNNSNRISPVLLIIIICIFIAVGIGIIFLVSFLTENKNNINNNNVKQPEYAFEYDINKNDVTESVSETITTSVVQESSFDANSLYRPDESYFCDQYKRYISGNFEGQGYAKMRFGPSKSKYNVVGQIDNGNIVTVQSLSVDGWTLIYYEGKEGWVRTDFLFESYEDCFYKENVKPDIELCGYTALVDVNGEYDGEPLNMRGGPSREYQLITTVPDGSIIELWGESSSTSEWTYVCYEGNFGWVLTKYLVINSVGDKPVLYLYPEVQTDVSVRVNLSDNMYFSCTYPEYNNGWEVTASPDGTLVNKSDGREYSYLYWELTGKQDYDFSKGFVVKGSDTVEFLQNKLSEIGLTPKEYNEFIVYWLPKMQNNEYNLISFQFNEYTDNVELDISPEPDSVLRVFMAYKALNEYHSIEPQHFDDFVRDGFAVVEWGGAEVK